MLVLDQPSKLRATPRCPMKSLAVLPSDLLQEIASYFDSQSDVLHFGQTVSVTSKLFSVDDEPKAGRP
jgi:hypothetical protein